MTEDHSPIVLYATPEEATRAHPHDILDITETNMAEITFKNLGNIPLVECSLCGATIKRGNDVIHSAWHTAQAGLTPRAEPKVNDEFEKAFLNATCVGFFYDRGGWMVLSFVRPVPGSETGESYDVRIDPKSVALDGVRPDMPQGVKEPGQ